MGNIVEPENSETVMKDYTFEEHIHRYSVWTAARASQRGFTTTVNVSKAIDNSNLRSFLTNKIETVSQFDTFHEECANRIIASFESQGITCTFGRAAKIIAIYLKTAIIVPKGPDAVLCLLIHPPIDRILLQNLAGQIELKTNESKSLKSYLLSINWTQLRQMEYKELISKIRAHYSFDWTLERFWIPAD